MPRGDVFKGAGAETMMESLFKSFDWNVASVEEKDTGTEMVLPSPRDSVPPSAFVIEDDVSETTEEEPRQPEVVNVLSAPEATCDAEPIERTL